MLRVSDGGINNKTSHLSDDGIVNDIDSDFKCDNDGNDEDNNNMNKIVQIMIMIVGNGAVSGQRPSENNRP